MEPFVLYFPRISCATAPHSRNSGAALWARRPEAALNFDWRDSAGSLRSARPAQGSGGLSRARRWPWPALEEGGEAGRPLAGGGAGFRRPRRGGGGRGEERSGAADPPKGSLWALGPQPSPWAEYPPGRWRTSPPTRTPPPGSGSLWQSSRRSRRLTRRNLSELNLPRNLSPSVALSARTLPGSVSRLGRRRRDVTALGECGDTLFRPAMRVRREAQRAERPSVRPSRSCWTRAWPHLRDWLGMGWEGQYRRRPRHAPPCLRVGVPSVSLSQWSGAWCAVRSRLQNSPL